MTSERKQQLQSELRALAKEGDSIYRTAIREHRDISDAESQKLDKAAERMDALEAELHGKPKQGGSFQDIHGRLSKFPNPIDPGTDDGAPAEVHGGPLKTGKWEELAQRYGMPVDLGDWESSDEFFRVALSRRHDPRLVQRFAMGTRILDEGGFLMPTVIAGRIADLSLESEIVRPRAAVYPITQGRSVNVPLWKDFDRSANGPAGIQAAWAGEHSTLTEQHPRITMMSLDAKKLSFLARVSNEEAEDVPGFSDSLMQALAAATSFNLDSAFLTGSGGPQPQGALTSAARVTVAKEDGQEADTLVIENIDQMWSRLLPGSHRNAIWVCNQTCIPQLSRLSLVIGTGGALVQALQSDGRGGYTLHGRPLLISEKLPVIGDEGDIALCDFSRYAIGLRADMRFDVSQHAAFSTDEVLIRLKVRIDGRPLDAKPIQPANGDPVSAFVTLGDR